MATRVGIEMGSYSPVGPNQPVQQSNYRSFFDLLERAAKAQYGANIRVLRTAPTMDRIDLLKEKLQVMSIIATAGPREIKRTITDVNLKEYTHHGQKGGADETVFKVINEVSYSRGERYHFAQTTGHGYDIGGNIGARLSPGVLPVGISAGFGANYHKSRSETAGAENSTDSMIKLTYEQEERIKVPPETQIKVKITSYKADYEQKYSMKVGFPSHFQIEFKYKTRCQQFCCGRRTGRITASQLLSAIPGYSLEGDKATITIDGVLTWISDGFGVEKFEESLI